MVIVSRAANPLRAAHGRALIMRISALVEVVVHRGELRDVRPSPLLIARYVCVVILALCCCTLLHAQNSPARRITQPINDNLRVALKGNVHPLAQPGYDQGAVPDSFAAQRMFLLLQRSAQQEFALRQFIISAQTPGNPEYHQWLKPEQFGELYGPADSDIAAVTAWLQSHGFSVARVTKGKTAIEFSGTAGQIRATFDTEIHNYLVHGEQHHANNLDPQIPAAIAAVVAGITALNDFSPRSLAEPLGKATYNPATHQVTPEWTLNQFALALAPGDFAVQYDLKPVYSAGTNGAGVTIGIISASTVDPGTVASYRSLFGLPPLTLNNIVDGNDPGQAPAIIEAHLDVELSGAVAPGAAINLYASAGTAVQYGINLAAQRAVDDDVAMVLSTSYGECEQNLGAAGNLFWAAVWEQATAQGQTSFVSSGDGGSAGCDDFDLPQPAQYGLAVNGISSTPWNVSVGGTDFYYTFYSEDESAQNTQLGTYWNMTSTNLPGTSLLKPIPEQVWNNAFGLNLATMGVYDQNRPTIVAGSGGASNCSAGVASPADPRFPYTSCIGGYTKPAWQTGTGVPADNVRDLPDVSLYAANGANYSFYPICIPLIDCNPSGGSVQVVGVGGTSASSPAMAGIMALINQRYGPQGQANFTLYPLAAQHPPAFHDVAVGSNNVPCEPGSPSCTLSTLNDNTSGFYTLGQYYAGTGYDLASGLGSVDGNLLLKYWTSLTFKPTETALGISQTTFSHGTPVNITVGVTGSGGTPSGDVALVSTAVPSLNTGLGEVTLQAGTATLALNSLPGGQYNVTARYAGDALFAPSTSSAVALNVSPEASTINFSGKTYNYATNIFDGITNGASIPYGSYIVIEAQPVGVHAAPGKSDGIATGTVSFTDISGNTTGGSGPLSLDSTGLAEWFNSNGFPVGTHSLAASYSGDASFNASATTAPLTFVIIKATSTVNLSAAANTIGLGASEALTVLVIASDNVPPPTGTATFYSGSTALGTAPLGADPYNPHVGQAVLNTSALPLGIDAVTATYNGNSNCNPATSSPVNITVKQLATVSALLSPNPFNEAQDFTLTINVSGAAGSPVPTGAAGYYGAGVGATATDFAALVNGSTALTGGGNFFNIGIVTFTVEYTGDSVYAPVNVTVATSDTLPFSVVGTSVTIAAPGATAGNASNVIITPMGGFTGAVNLACKLSASPAGANYLPTCSVVPASVTISSATAATVMMKISSTAATSGAAVSPALKGMSWLGGGLGSGVFGILILLVPKRSRTRRSLLSLALVLAIIGGLVRCGGGTNGGGGGGGGGGISGTTSGSYLFVITATTPGPNAGLPTVSVNGSVTATIQ
jgi:hypothetical protein